MEYLLLIICFIAWFALARLYAKRLNRRIILENARLTVENGMLSRRAIQSGLDISRLERDLKDARKTKPLNIGFDFETARNELTRKGDAL